MESKLKKAYSEVWSILKRLDFRYVEALPKAIVDVIKKNMDVSYQPDYVDSRSISREALTIISILNVKFWEQDCERLRDLRRIYSNNEAKWRLKQGIES